MKVYKHQNILQEEQEVLSPSLKSLASFKSLPTS